jgi:hypothetical protein
MFVFARRGIRGATIARDKYQGNSWSGEAVTCANVRIDAEQATPDAALKVGQMTADERACCKALDGEKIVYC